jgi:1,4-dihydroxy-2-naphthoyl-CoA synthase
MAAFFTQTGRMNTGVKGGSGSNIYQKLLGQKKAFEVIQKTNVKF